MPANTASVEGATWLGHKRIDETMIYVHVAKAHARELPECVIAAAHGEIDLDRRVLEMLGAQAATWQRAGPPKTKEQPRRLLESCERGDSNPTKTVRLQLESRGLAVFFVG